MNRIYHPYDKWEDFKHGFYDNISGKNKQQLAVKVVELFENKENTERYMRMVVEQWPNSCEHNLSNLSMNRIAYLGQAACCIYAGVPCSVTMEVWSTVNQESRNEADRIAKEIIKEWEVKYA